MDDVDRRIVALLRENARRSFKDIGSHVGLTAPAVKRRVDRLEADATRAEMIEGIRRTIDPYIAAGNALVDDIIDPRETRPTVIRALEMAETKRVQRPRKKHGVMPV